MSSTKLMFLLAFWFFALSIDGTETQDTYSDGLSPPGDCGNCSVCPYPCHPQPPPPSGARPMEHHLLPPSGFPSYSAPPPPPAQVNCPPAPLQCCGQGQYSPPMPYYYPYSNYSGSTQLLPLIKSSTSTWSFAIFFVSIICFAFHV